MYSMNYLYYDNANYVVFLSKIIISLSLTGNFEIYQKYFEL